MARVQAIHLSAVKSLRLQSVTEARIDRDGIAGDREFLLLDDRNRATTQRELGVLAQVSSRYDGTVLELQMPDGEVISGEPRHGELAHTDLWGRAVTGPLVEGPWAEALSKLAQKRLRLMHPDAAERGLDSHAVSMLSQAAVDQLGAHAGRNGDLDARRFRPTVLINDCERPRRGRVGGTFSAGRRGRDHGGALRPSLRAHDTPPRDRRARRRHAALDRPDPRESRGRSLLWGVRRRRQAGYRPRRRYRRASPGGQWMTNAIPAFRNHLPVKIRFGDGCSADLAQVLADEDATRPLIVIDAGLAEMVPGVAAALAPLTDAVHYEKAPGEPTVALVETVAASAARERLRLGGGDRRRLGDGHRQGRAAGRRTGRPVHALRPRGGHLRGTRTTAGVRAHHRGHRQRGLRRRGHHRRGHPHQGRASPARCCAPSTRWSTPSLTHGLPPKLTAYTGIDALAQAIAAMVVKVRTPIGDGIALESIRLGGRGAARVVADGSDAAARSAMACSSLMAGLCMNISDCGSEHSLGQAIGGLLGLPHGLTIGLVLAETMDRDRVHVPEQFERIADALGEPDDGSGDGSRAVTGGAAGSSSSSSSRR